MITYLYIKQHTITNKLYFGKTTKNPENYLGSGKHWQRHIKKHGKEYVVNLWYQAFEDQNECTNFALEFSDAMNIVESDQWLNLIPENGLDGMPIGFTHSEDTKLKFASRIISEEQKSKMSLSHIGHICSDETKSKMSKTRLGRKHPRVTCPHCLKTGGTSPMARFHFDNCKSIV